MVQGAVLVSPDRGGEVQIPGLIPVLSDVEADMIGETDDRVLAEQLVRPILPELGPTQAQVAQLIMSGLSRAEAASALGVNQNVVGKALRSMGREIRANTRNLNPLDIPGDVQLDAFYATEPSPRRSSLPAEVVANRRPKVFPRDEPTHVEPFFPQDVGAF